MVTMATISYSACFSYFFYLGLPSYQVWSCYHYGEK